MLPKATLPELRRPKLRSLIEAGLRPVKVMEAHNGISALVANDSQIKDQRGESRSFDGIWISSLTESGSKGLPDVELQGMIARVDLIREVLGVSDKPLVVDGDTGGTIDQLQYAVRTLESLGVSAFVIEDKVFPKSNSLDFNKPQTLEDPVVFSRKIKAAIAAKSTQDFMVIARIEALVAGKDLSEALHRAKLYVEAGADGIVIHSRSKSPESVLEFAREFKSICAKAGREVPLVAIPTTYCSITEDQLFDAGFKMVIHANHLLRSAYKAMKETAELILTHGRSLEVDSRCASLGSLLDLIEPAGPCLLP